MYTMRVILDGQYRVETFDASSANEAVKMFLKALELRGWENKEYEIFSCKEEECSIRKFYRVVLKKIRTAWNVKRYGEDLEQTICLSSLSGRPPVKEDFHHFDGIFNFSHELDYIKSCEEIEYDKLTAFELGQAKRIYF